MRIFCSAKNSPIFSTKNISIFVIFTFKIDFKETLTNVVINFEQPTLELHLHEYKVNVVSILRM